MFGKSPGEYMKKIIGDKTCRRLVFIKVEDYRIYQEPVGGILTTIGEEIRDLGNMR